MSSSGGSGSEKSPEKGAVPRKMRVVPSSPDREQEKRDSTAIELHEMPDGPEEIVTFGKKMATSASASAGGKDEEKKKPSAGMLVKLFKYATYLDVFLILMSLVFALCHGSALPLAMYVFGDLTNIFANYDITLQTFEDATSNLSSAYGGYTFLDGPPNGNATTIQEAVNTMTVYPDLLDTQEDFMDFLFVSLSPTTTNVTELNASIPTYSCVVFTFAEEMEPPLTGYQVFQNVSQGDLILSATDGTCSCLQPAFEVFSEDARCLTNDAFIFGTSTGDGVVWQIYYFVFITIGVFISGYFQIALMQMAAERQVNRIRKLYFQSVLRQEIGWFDCTPSGELATRLNDDVDKIHDGIGDKFAIFVQWIATFFAGFAVAFARDWRLTLFMLAITPVLAAVAAVFSKIAAAFTSQEQKLYASAGAVAEEVLGSVRTVVAFGGEFKESSRYEEKLRLARSLGAKKGLSVGTSFFMIYFVLFACYAAAFWFGGFLVRERILQVGDMLAVFFSVLIGAFSLGQAAPNIEALSTAAGSAVEIYNTICRVSAIDPASEEGEKPDKFESTVQFKDVSFSYPARPDVEVLKGVSLEVKTGQTVALVGSSGCGKSTVVQLLQRFYDVAGGQVLVSGVDVRELNTKWLRSNIGVVSQEPVLFDTTIAENIRFGKEDATREQIEAAAKAANAHDFISGLPAGYETQVGDRGTQMSGGQKQRIAIARALVRDPKLLLLDEATSALDAESEKIVQEALDKAREGRTTIIIAHRLSTIQTANVIIGIEDGRVVEAGSHSELMKKEGLYYDLVNAQTYGDVDQVVVDGKAVVARRKSTRLRKRSRHTRRRGDSESEETSVARSGSRRFDSQLSRQASHPSITDDDALDGHVEVAKLKEEELDKLQEEWDKNIPEVKLTRVIALNAKEWWLMVLGILGAAVSGAIYPAFAIIFGSLLDIFTLPPEEIFDEIHVWAAMFLVLGLVSGIAIFLKTVCFTVSGEVLTARLRELSFKAMLRQEMGWHDLEQNSTGILTTRLAQDASRVQGATGTRLGTVVEGMVGMVLALIIALVYSWLLTIVLLGLVPILMLSGFLQLKALTGHASKTKKALEKAGKLVVDSVENIRTVASLGLEVWFNNRYKDELRAPYRRSIINSSVYGLTYGFSQSFFYPGYILTFGFGAWLMTQPPDSILNENFRDVFIVFSAVIFGAMGVGQAGAFAPNYAKAKLSANRIFFLLDRQPEIDGYSEDGVVPDKVAGHLEFRDVEFNYPSRPDSKVLQGLSLSMQAGQTLALVGPSGCGKSTTVSLVERFYNPLGGSVALDGVNIADLNIRWLRSQIGIVSQEPVLFDASIADNISYGALFRKVSDEEIIEAAKAANIHNFIQTLPEGYATNVGAKGTQISGGQKQRIAIARALIRDPKILLLDEATSALDTESEKIVQEALDKAREGRSSIVIAHRLSTVYNSDSIAVISDGRVAEQGKHKELLEKKGIYFNLNQYQLMEEEETDHVASPGPLEGDAAFM